jgi:DNA-binding response OmpR family regulator
MPVSSTRRRFPAFSSRPDFPKGLKVLVVDDSAPRSAKAASLLSQCGFCPVVARTLAESVLQLTSAAPDVMLVEVTMLSSNKGGDTAAILAAAKTLPLVLSGSNLRPEEIIAGINMQGAVDFMEQPLHMDKLKNIWQHLVRRHINPSVITRGNVCGGSRSECVSAGSAYATATPDSSDIFSGALDSLGTDSTQEDWMDLDLETTSLLDAADLALDSPLAGLAQGFSHLLMGEQSDTKRHSNSSNGNSNSNQPKPRLSGELRRPRLTPARSLSQPLSLAPSDAICASSKTSRLVIGHSCGQLPALPASNAGMAWGLPTNPLTFGPKPMLSGPPMMPPPWMSHMMMPMPGMMMPPPPGMFGMVPPMGPGCMMPLPPTPASAALGGYRRTDSCPVIGHAAPAMPPGGMVHSLSLCDVNNSSGGAAGAKKLRTEETALGLCSLAEKGLEKPPIGLHLKKSPSFIDMLNSRLELGMKSVAAIL